VPKKKKRVKILLGVRQRTWGGEKNEDKVKGKRRPRKKEGGSGRKKYGRKKRTGGTWDRTAGQLGPT